MGHAWKHQLVTLLSLLYLYQCLGFQINDENSVIEPSKYISDDNELVGDDLEKRFSKFVRIGRGLSSFVRIGRNSPTEEFDLYPVDDEPLEETGSFVLEPVNSAFIGYQPDEIVTPLKRFSSFVRIGRNYDNDINEREDDVQKRGGTFIRMGKFPSSAFIRTREDIYRHNQQPYYRRTGRIGHSSFIRIGKRDTADALQRIEQYENKDDENQTKETKGIVEKETNNDTDDITNINELIRIITNDEGLNEADRNVEEGSEPGDSDEERRYLRIGRDRNEKFHTNAETKRMSNFVRIGKNYHTGSFNGWSDSIKDAQDKRLSNFVRIGKRNLDERLNYFDRPIGMSDEQPMDENKRYSSFVRIGKNAFPPTQDKRFSSFVRIGKSATQFDPYLDKRFSSFVRIGKSLSPLDDKEKRYSSFVRIGKSDDYDKSLKNEKRMSSFVRIGRDYLGLDDQLDKRLSSFVRVGKNRPFENSADKRYSSFVRIGKSSEEPDTESYLTPDIDTVIHGQKDFGASSIMRNSNLQPDNLDNEDKRALSKFVRIGKDTQKEDNINKAA